MACQKCACFDHQLAIRMARAIISGGSIGGLSTAHALLRAGLEVLVFEKSSSVSAAGAVRQKLALTFQLPHLGELADSSLRTFSAGPGTR